MSYLMTSRDLGFADVLVPRTILVILQQLRVLPTCDFFYHYLGSSCPAEMIYLRGTGTRENLCNKCWNVLLGWTNCSSTTADPSPTPNSHSNPGAFSFSTLWGTAPSFLWRYIGEGDRLGKTRPTAGSCHGEHQLVERCHLKAKPPSLAADTCYRNAAGKGCCFLCRNIWSWGFARGLTGISSDWKSKTTLMPPVLMSPSHISVPWNYTRQD